MKINRILSGIIGCLVLAASALAFEPPAGTNGQTQYNNNGRPGAYTVGGDCTIVPSTGVTTCTKTGGVSFSPSATTDTTNAANISSGTLASARGGAGSVTGALKANGSGLVSQAACGDLSNGAASCSTDTTNAGNISSGTLAAARGGAGAVTGALKANGSGLVTQAACGDLSNGAASCSTDTTNAANISSGLLALARLSVAGTAQGALDVFFNTPIALSSPVLVLCTGSGDESAFNSAGPTAASRKTAMLVGPGCQPANQWLASQYTALTAWAGATTDINTMGSAEPSISVFSSGVAANAPGAAFIDLHAPRTFSMQNLNLMGQNIAEPATLIENSAQNGSCCATNAFQAFNSSFGNTSAAIGTPLDGNYNPIQVNGVRTVTLTAGGTGYVDGAYFKVPLTGGTGTGSFANIITVSGGIVTAVNMGGVGNEYWKYPGTGFAVNDILSASNANLGGTGSGLQITVTGLTKATPTAANTLIRFDKVQFANIGTVGGALNSSDTFGRNFEFTGGPGVFWMPIFGGGGNDFGNFRGEFYEKGFWFGGPNAGTQNGGTMIHDGVFDFVGQNYDSGSRTTLHPDAVEIDSSTGYNLVNLIHMRPGSTSAPIQIGGAGANTKLSDVIVMANNQPSIFSNGTTGGIQNSCIDIENGGNGAVPDNIFIDGTTCNPGNDAESIHLGVIPTHFHFNAMASAHFTNSTRNGQGYWWDQTGRPLAIADVGNSNLPNTLTSIDLKNTIRPFNLPNTPTASLPTGSNGMMAFDTTANVVKVFYGGVYNTLSTLAIGGSNTQIQFNNSGALGGDSTFTFNNSTHTEAVQNLTVSGTCTGCSGTTNQTNLALQPYGIYTADTTGKLFPNFYTGSGGNAAPTDYGWGVVASLSADVVLQTRFMVPPALPVGTANIRMVCLANATAGNAKFTVSDGQVATGSSPSAATLTAETQSTITWAAGGADKYNFVDVPITTSPAVNNVLVAAVTFQTSGWTLASTLTCLQPTLVWK